MSQGLRSCTFLVLIVALSSPSATADSIDEAFEKVASTYLHTANPQKLPRKMSFRLEDWPKNTTIVRVSRSRIPVFTEPSLTSQKLDILCLTQFRELFSVIRATEIVKIVNPLGGGVDDSGIWCLVRLYDGRQGWILAEPSAAPGQKYVEVLRTSAETSGKTASSDSILQPQAARGGKGLFLIVASVVISFFVIVAASRRGDFSEKAANSLAIGVTSFMGIVIAAGIVWIWVDLCRLPRDEGWGAFLRIATVFGGGVLLVGVSPYYLQLLFEIADRLPSFFVRMQGGPPWHKDPVDPSKYPEDWQEYLKGPLLKLVELLEKEASVLASSDVQVPVPQVIRELTTVLHANEAMLKESREYSPHHIQIHLMDFHIPSYGFFQLFEPSTLNGRPGAGYLVSARSQVVAEAERTFQANGLDEVVRNHPGKWFNRNPYAAFEIVRGQRSLEIDRYGKYESAFLDNLDEVCGRHALKKLRAFGELETAQIVWRMRLLKSLLADTDVPFEKALQVPPWVPDSIASDLPVPRLSLGQDQITLSVTPPESLRSSRAAQFFQSLRKLAHGFAFEMVDDGTTIYFQISINAQDRDLVENQLQVHFPGCVLAAGRNWPPFKEPIFKAVIAPTHGFRQIKTPKENSPDPYSSLFSLLDKRNSDFFCLQVLAYPDQDETLQRICTELERLSSKEVLSELQQLWGWQDVGKNRDSLSAKSQQTQQKLRQRADELKKKLPTWFASVRTYSSDSRLLEMLPQQWLAQFESPDQTIRLAAAKPCGGVDRAWENWGLYAAEELAALSHFPDNLVQCSRVERTSSKMKAPPPVLTQSGSAFGECEYRGQRILVRLPDGVRDRHVYLIGKTRTGKSTLMMNLAIQDITNGDGVCVIDPHGDLVQDLLRAIPRERGQDTIYFNAAEKEFPIALNIMDTGGDEEIGLLADDLVVTFRRISESWGERMEGVLRYVFHTLLRVKGTTFFDLQHVLVNPRIRERIVAQIDSPPLLSFWREQFPKLPKEALQPILSRMSKFVLSPVLAGILGQPESKLRFGEVIARKQILLVNLSQGTVGDDTAKLLGSVLVSQIQLAAMRQARLPKDSRVPFHLYVDEFQNFTTSAFDKILSEAGKYRLCLALAHQYISQLDERLRHAILGNVGTLICFQLWPEDARHLKGELGVFEPDDTANLAVHEALCRPPTRSTDTFRMKTLPPSTRVVNLASEIIEYTQRVYGRPAQPVSWPMPEAKVETPKAAMVADPAESFHDQESAIPKHLIEVAQPPAKPAVANHDSKEKATAKPRLPLEERDLGRGGQEHKRTQAFIKKCGEEFGYRAVIEFSILGGQGSVDVALEKKTSRIACEISVTTNPEHEVENVRKCLAAGFTHVVALSEQPRSLKTLEELLGKVLNDDDRKRVQFKSKEEFLIFLKQIEADAAGGEQLFRGRTVRSILKPRKDDKTRKNSLVKTAIDSVRRRLS